MMNKQMSKLVCSWTRSIISHSLVPIDLDLQLLGSIILPTAQKKVSSLLESFHSTEVVRAGGVIPNTGWTQWRH